MGDKIGQEVNTQMPEGRNSCKVLMQLVEWAGRGVVGDKAREEGRG